ncbi:MAG: DUF4175 family protein [Alphaproteobacteria bacterium]|nr:DUF4175 family protein [Alphaproteobacteria bacterium]
MGWFDTFSQILQRARNLRGIAIGVACVTVFLLASVKGTDFVATLKPEAERALALDKAAPPDVSMTEAPVLTENKTVRLAYKASDAFGLTEIALRVTPHDPLPGADQSPIEIPLSAETAKQISRADFEDLASRPWAGQKVTLQIVATNEAGKKGFSQTADITLPQRSFFHPLARILIEERKKLMQHPDDEKLRDEAANIMAGIAQEPPDYRNDPVILLALRSGAVRLILNHDRAAAVSVNDILWQTAIRIEDGIPKTAQSALRDTRQDIAEKSLPFGLLSFARSQIICFS